MVAGERRPAVAVRVLVLAVVAALGLGAYYWFGRMRANDGRIEGSGTIEATQVSVAPKVAGRVMTIRAREGAVVTVGQVVAELDHEELDAQVAQAEAAVSVARARVGQAQSALSAAAGAGDRRGRSGSGRGRGKPHPCAAGRTSRRRAGIDGFGRDPTSAGSGRRGHGAGRRRRCRHASG